MEGPATSPTVSVVIPVRDGERYLAEAIDSVLAQGPGVTEVIVVDDGSQDASAAVAESFAAPVRCLRRPPTGPGAARNAGVAAARGELLGFLDADDRWAEDALPVRLAALTADPALELVFGHVREFVDPGTDPALAARVVLRPETEFGNVLGAMLARRETVDRVGRFREDIVAGDFIDWMARAQEAGVATGVVPDVVLCRRVHGHNLTRQNPAVGDSYLQVVRAALTRRRELGPQR